MFRRKQDTCATCGCEGKPIGTLQIRFKVGNTTCLGFYRECADCYKHFLTIPKIYGSEYTWKPDECDHIWKMDDNGISRCVRCYSPRPPKHER